MPRGSSPKRERQYEHINESAEGRSAMSKAQRARALGR